MADRSEDAANILGDSPAIIRKHYAKRSRDSQNQKVELFGRIHGAGMVTPRTRYEQCRILGSIDSVVAEVGLEPTRPVKCAGF